MGMIVGAIAGTASAIGFAFIQPYMHHPDRKVPVHDTRGVLSLHLIPDSLELSEVSSPLQSLPALVSTLKSTVNLSLLFSTPQEKTKQATNALLFLLLSESLSSEESFPVLSSGSSKDLDSVSSSSPINKNGKFLLTSKDYVL